MGKLPYQLITNVLSFIGVLGFVMWTSHGGLQKQIYQYFGSDATSSNLKDRVGHMSDLLFYYAFFATFLCVILPILKLIQLKLLPRLQSLLPTMASISSLLIENVHSFVIFSGIYVYLIYNDGMGLKNKQIALFPFWFLLFIVLEVVGRAFTTIASQKVIFTRASFFLYVVLIGTMLAQIAGYKPFNKI